MDETRNPYGYTQGNPLQFVDPLGLTWGLADKMDLLSTTLGGLALVLTLTGAAAPAGVILGGVAAAAAMVAAGTRYAKGKAGTKWP